MLTSNSDAKYSPRPPPDISLPSELWQVVASFLPDFDIWKLRYFHRVFLDLALNRVYRHAHVTYDGIMFYEPLQDFRPNVLDSSKSFGYIPRVHRTQLSAFISSHIRELYLSHPRCCSRPWLSPYPPFDSRRHPKRITENSLSRFKHWIHLDKTGGLGATNEGIFSSAASIEVKMPHRLHSPASLKEVQAFRILSIAPLKEIETLHIDIFGPLDCPLIAQAWSNFSHQLTSLQVNLTIQDFSDQLVLTGTCTTLLSLSLTLTLAQAPIEVTAQIVHNFYQLCPHTLQTLRLRWDRPTANFTRFFEARKFPELRRLTVRGPEFLNTLSSPHPHVTALSNYLIHPPQTLKHVALGRAYSEAKIDISLLQQLKFSASTSNLHLMGQLRFHSRWLTQLELHVLYSEPAGDDLSDKVAPALSQAASLERLKITSYTFSVRGVASVANYIPGLKLFWWHTSRFERTGMYYVPGTILPFALDIELRGSTFRKWKLVHLWVNVLGQSISRDLHAMLAPFCRNMTGYGANVEEEGGVLNELLGQWDFKDSFWLDH